MPARDVYVKRRPGRGWPEACPPIRAANAFGFDVPANFDVTFVRGRGGWRATPDVEVASDFTGQTQQYAWFWERGQTLPHRIDDHVYREIRNQVKISSFLYLKTDPGEMLLMAPVPNLTRPWRAMTALVETDWYPANYPWHVVVELDPRARRIKIRRGEPLCRLIPVRRGRYAARPMSDRAFAAFFGRAQSWLAEHGRGDPHMADITGRYARQQTRARFEVRQSRTGSGVAASSGPPARSTASSQRR